MAKRLKRKHAPVTFSVSVDPDTRALLRRIADEAYQGNVSALISEIAQQAARQAAARELLRLHGQRPMTDDEAATFQAEVDAELAGRPATRKRRRVA
jgi:hypothetical protein